MTGAEHDVAADRIGLRADIARGPLRIGTDVHAHTREVMTEALFHVALQFPAQRSAGMGQSPSDAIRHRLVGACRLRLDGMNMCRCARNGLMPLGSRYGLG